MSRVPVSLQASLALAPLLLLAGVRGGTTARERGSSTPAARASLRLEPSRPLGPDRSSACDWSAPALRMPLLRRPEDPGGPSLEEAGHAPASTASLRARVRGQVRRAGRPVSGCDLSFIRVDDASGAD